MFQGLFSSVMCNSHPCVIPARLAVDIGQSANAKLHLDSRTVFLSCCEILTGFVLFLSLKALLMACQFELVMGLHG